MSAREMHEMVEHLYSAGWTRGAAIQYVTYLTALRVED